MRIRSFLGPLYWATLCWMVVSFSTHASTLSFSARLVNSDGSPVTGLVDLKFELAYSNDISNILCTKSLPDVELSSGVFHANLKFAALDCTGSQELYEVLEATPPNESLMMRVVDETDSANPKTYPFQALNTVPMSVMSEISQTLIQMGATNGQVLKWDGTQWAPGSDDGEAGTVTQIDTGAGLTGGPITGSGTIAIVSGGVEEAMLAADSVTSAKVVDGTIQNADIADGQIKYIKLNLSAGEVPNDRIAGLGSAALADIGTSAGMVMGSDAVPNCTANQKLQMSLGPTFSWSCVDDSTATDNTKLPLAGGTMSGTINMNGNAIENLQTPLLDGDAATKKYVDDGLSLKADSTEFSNYVAKAGDNMTGALQLDAQNELRLADSDSTNYVALRSSATVATNFILTLPNSAGSADQVLTTDGTGVLTWSTPSSTATPEGSAGGELAGTYPDPLIADGVIDDANVMVGANISAAKVGTGVVDNTEFNALDGVTSSIQTQLDSKEGTIAAGTTSQYRRGDKTWQTLDTSVVPENGNLYFTNARAQGAVVTQTITDAVTATSPSEDAVFDALALKADQSSLSNYVLKTGDSMSGTLDMGANTVTNLAAPNVAADATTKQYVDDGLATKANSTDLNNYVEIAGSDMTGTLGLNAQNQIQFRDSDSSNYVALRSPGIVSANVTFNLPAADGTAGQILSTDGAGNLSWSSSGDGSVTDVTATVPIASTGGATPNLSITQANSTTDGYLSSTDWNAFNNKEPAVTAGTTAQYRRGDKTWQTLDTSVVPENTNLYYTTTRARTDAVDDAIVDAVTDVAPSQNAVFDALALKANSTDLNNYVEIAGDDMTGALGLNAQNQLQFRDSDSTNYVALRSPATVSANVVFNLPGADGTAGQVLSTDGAGNLAWASSGDGSVTSVTATAPLSSSGTNTPDISISQANSTSDGYLSSTDWNTFNNKEPAVTTGTTAQYRRGDKTWQTLDTAAVPENGNLYYTTARARTDAVDDAIVDAVTDVAPSQNAVFDALALKADQSSLSNYVLKAGDTMTGTLNLPTDGLSVGTSQLFATGGNVGIGTTSPTAILEVSSGLDPTSLRVTETTGADNNWEIRAYDTALGGSYNQFSIWGGLSGSTQTDRLVIDPSGNIGIGTTSPAEKLSVNGMIQTTSGGIKFPDGTVQGTAANNVVGFSVYNTADTGLSSAYPWTGIRHNDGNYDSTTGRFTAPISGRYHLCTGGIEQDNSLIGRWHIEVNGVKASSQCRSDGGGSPDYGQCAVCSTVSMNAGDYATVDIFEAGIYSGYGYFTGFLVGGGTGGSGAADNLGDHVATQNIVLGSNWISGDGGNEGIQVDQTGNVGIGTTSPDAKLALKGDGSTAGSSAIHFRHGTSTGISIGLNRTTDDLQIGNSWNPESGTYLTVDNSSGNVGIGTSTPAENLEVNGQVRVTSPWRGIQLDDTSSSGGHRYDFIVGSIGSTTSSFGIYDDTAGAYRFNVLENGNVGIGTTSPSYKLDVNGTLRAYGITDSSDERLKEDIRPLRSSLEKIIQLQGVEYFWRDRTIDSELQIGLIAQDIEKVFPELVKTDPSGMKSVNYSHLVAPLIEATKEQQIQIESNRKMFKIMQGEVVENSRKIASLEEEVKVLKDKNESLQQTVKGLQGKVNVMEEALCEVTPQKSFCP